MHQESRRRPVTRPLLLGVLLVVLGAQPVAATLTGADTRYLTADDIPSTAIAHSRLAYADGDGDIPSAPATEVLLGTASTFADNLAAGSLSGQSLAGGRPLLLNPLADDVPAATLAEIDRVHVGIPVEDVTVHVLGGEARQGPGVVAALEALGYRVNRFGGETRIETAIQMAQAAEASTALIVRAFTTPEGDATQAFADSLTAGALAATAGYATLFTETDVLTGATAAHLASAGYDRAIIIGGDQAVSPAVEAAVRALIPDTTRAGGATRYDTQIAVDALRPRPLGPAAILVDGQDPSSWADAFAAANLSGLANLPVLLVDGDRLPDQTRQHLRTGHEDAPRFTSHLDRFVAFCGTTVAPGTCQQVADLFGGRTGPFVDGEAPPPAGGGDAPPLPTITSATYDAASGVLAVTGTALPAMAGPANDIDVSRLSVVGEGGALRTLTSPDVERTSATSFAVTLDAADRDAVGVLLNQDGTASTGGDAHRLDAAEDWAAGAPPATVVADPGNALTVSNVPLPTITSATYDAAAGRLVVTGSGLVSSGAGADIDASLLSVIGSGGGSRTLTDTPDVEVTSGTSFMLVLSPTDRVAASAIVDADGLTALDDAAYRLAADDGWVVGAPAAADIADLTGNPVTASRVGVAAIDTATYDASTGQLTVTGTGFVENGSGADIDVDRLVVVGEGGMSRGLGSSADVEIAFMSATSFTVQLDAVDRAAVGAIVNRSGSVSTGGTPYRLDAADDWLTQVTLGDTSDTGNALVASGVPMPTITSATYDAATGTLAVTGTELTSRAGAGNDVDASRLVLVGEGGAGHALTDTADADVTSGSAFTLTLSAGDRAAVGLILNKSGTSSVGGTTYNLAAAEDWAAGADPAVAVADLTGNGTTVSNVPVPAITAATYDAATGRLVVTGSGLTSRAGATNDIVANRFTLTGEGGATYTLTDTANVDVAGPTSFTLQLSATDRFGIASILNANGTSSVGGTTYLLAAAEDWAAGADAPVVVADLVGNPVTASNVP